MSDASPPEPERFDFPDADELIAEMKKLINKLLDQLDVLAAEYPDAKEAIKRVRDAVNAIFTVEQINRLIPAILPEVFQLVRTLKGPPPVVNDADFA